MGITDMNDIKEFDTIRESWINGNLSDIADKIGKWKRSKILGFVVYLIDENKPDIIDDIESLARMLDNRNL